MKEQFSNVSRETWKEVGRMDAFIQLISNVGFPICAFLLMYNQSNTIIKENTKAITELKNEISKNKS